MRLVDADFIKESVKRQCDDCRNNGMKRNADMVEKAINVELDNTPTIDALEVVRCKDCKHRQEDTIFHKLYCDGREVVADGFCWKGERRSDE